MDTDRLIYEVRKLSITEGDVVLLKCARTLRCDQVEAMREQLKAVIPDGVSCLVVPTDFDFAVMTAENKAAVAAAFGVPSIG